MKTTIFAAATAAAALIGSAAVSQDNPMVGGAPMMADMTIVENASQAPNLTTLVSAVQAAELVETLSGEGPFTVFAPTNAAFDMIADESLQTLLAPENQAALQQVLTCHVVGAEAFSTAIAGMIADDGGVHPIETVGGCTMEAYMEGGMIMLRDPNGRVATVTTADVDQSNGVVHVIDRVLLPAGYAG
ncbi:fasciclin domain-containing protein [Histidinibacterium aquaticum]|uniref:Fasciclin domain-containing protein n=1 Tax=Histidinibacterium aquaticum TaxID=2613962 RepID=A0A5J5GCE5_9RHOB|nr:fasciclin domain-containing protein [Histidinibacterium aquaticum]KAA9005701.1 fasciclin domain-containing protein [Histidinibacterium aquaticum]